LIRLINKIKKYNFTDACRKITYFLAGYLGALIHLFRKIRFYFFTKCWVKNILGTVYFSTITLHIKIGRNATFYPAIVLEIAENATLSIGDNFTLSYGAVIACNRSVTIGNFVMIGEYSSVRDTTHNHEYSNVPYIKQGDTSEEIFIGNNVWIGRGSIILAGSVIEDGVIIGAHSVVKGHLKAYCMYAGAPLKMIRELLPVQNPV